jgi:hypothetical protein
MLAQRFAGSVSPMGVIETLEGSGLELGGKLHSGQSPTSSPPGQLSLPPHGVI